MSRQILLCSIAIALLASAACSKRTTESAPDEFASLRAKADAGNAAAQLVDGLDQVVAFLDQPVELLGNLLGLFVGTQVDAAQQYELMVRQTDGDGELVVKRVDLFLESNKLAPEFVKRTQQSGVFNLNVTAFPSNKPDWCRVQVILYNDHPTTSKGEVLLRKRPLK